MITINGKNYEEIKEDKEFTCPICGRELKINRYVKEDGVAICYPCFKHIEAGEE